MARRGDNIHKRKDGRWEGRYKNGFKTDGSVKYSSVYAYTYTECKHILAEMKTYSRDEKFKVSTEKKFADVLHKWISANQIRLKGATVAKYMNVIQTHILPALGGIKMSKIESGTINLFLEKQLKGGGLNHGEALSPSYVRTMAIIIEAVINYAVTEGLCSPLRSPINKPVIPKKDLLILTRFEEENLTKKLLLDFSKTAMGTLLALQAGLRIGEVCALRWSDIDFEKNLIHVRNTVARVIDGNNESKTKSVIDLPKTASSLRDVPMTSTLRNVCLVALGNRTSEYVVSNNKAFVSTRTFDYRYRQLLKKHGIPEVAFHTLRHTYATRCAENGMDAKTLSRLLGHSSSNTSLNIYVHPSLDIAMQFVEKIYCSV